MNPAAHATQVHDLPVYYRHWWAPCLLLVAACGPFCGPTAFSLGSTSVDPSYSCPVGTGQQAYDLHVTVPADNPTSQDVTIKSATASMVVAAVHGRWQQPVGFRYDAGQVSVSPNRVGSRSKATLHLTIPSACSNSKHSGTADNYADYTVEVTLVTSAGTHKLTAQNKHRILAP